MVLYVYVDLCSLLAVTSQFSILVGQNMQLTGCHNGNEMRNAWTPKFQLSVPTGHSLYCARTSYKVVFLSRYICLLESFLHHTPVEHKDHKKLIKAIEQLKKLKLLFDEVG